MDAALSDHEKVTKQKLTAFNYAVAAFAGIGSFLFGYDSGIISSVISDTYIHFHDYFDSPTDTQKGAIVSLLAGGCFFGAMMAGYTSNKFGRKRTIQIGSAIAVIGCSLQTGAVNLGMLMAGRFIAGLAIGCLSMIVPLYQSELSPPKFRGQLSGMTQLLISFGFFIANWVGYGCQGLNNDMQWRIPLLIQVIPAVILFSGMFVLPYSPRWLAQQGRDDEALASLKRVHGSHTNERVVMLEFEEIREQIAWERENVSANFLDLFKTWPALHRTLCGCLVQICCQWTGVNVASYFGPTIYKNLGYNDNTVLLINGIYGAWGLVVTFCFITFIVDSIGRRKPLIFGGVSMAVMLAWEAGIGSMFAKPGYSNPSDGIAGIAAIFLFSMCFSVSFGPVSWIYQSEVFAMPVRSMGTSLSTCSNWAMNVLISQITPIGLTNLNWKFFFVFVATNVVNSVVAYLLFPETKGLTLEGIALVFGDESNVVTPPSMQRNTAYASEKGEKGLDGEHVEAVPSLGA